MTRSRRLAVFSVLLLAGSLFAAVAPSEATATAPHYRPLSIRAKRAPAYSSGVPTFADDPGTNPVTPSDLHAAYGIPHTTITTTIAVVDAYGDSAVEANLATYRTMFDLPSCTRANGCLTVVNQSGGTSLPADDAGWAAETDLDVQMISAVCASCHILLVEASDDGYGLDQAVRFALTQADFVSLSWGATEDASQNDVINQLATPGKVITVASGDAGYGGDSPGYPATDPHVVAVGGTTLHYNAGVWNDTVWNDGDGSTGSGCSLHEPQPSWQAALPALTAACSRRMDNDLAIVADPETGVAQYTAGGWWFAGGTSAGAPMVAALYAIADAGQRPSSAVGAAEMLYQHPASFRDVTSGTDGICSPTLQCTAAKCYDGPSGLGVPRGVAAFLPTTAHSVCSPPGPRASAVAYSRSASAVTYGRSVTLTGTVTDRASHARLGAAKVQLQARTSSGWHVVRTVGASSAGVVRAAVTPARGTTYRWYLPAYSASGVPHAAAASVAFAVAVKIAPGTTRLTDALRVGHRVRVKTVGWGPSGVTYRFTWYVGSKRVATGRALTLANAWRGKRLRVQVVARAAGLRAVSAHTTPRRISK